MYTDFAGIYDLLMQDVDYDAWSVHLLRLLASRGIGKGASCAECACGTGSLTIRLSLAGLKMTGVDLSGEMLAAAMKKAGDAGCRIPFIRRNMTELELPRRVHAVLCTCDGVNYLNKADALRFFEHAHACLRPGGVLLFDVSTPHKLRNVLGDRTLTRREDDFCYIWENRWNGVSGTVRMHVTAFVRAAGGAYGRVEESQTQYAHDRNFLKKQLLQAGFTDIAFYGGMRETPARSDDDRWHIIASKPLGGSHV